MTAPNSSRENQQSSPPNVRNQFNLKTEHTPPPIIIKDGSLIIEMGTTLLESRSGARWIYTTADPCKIEQLKIVDDTATMLYRNSSAEGCSIKLWLQTPSPHSEAYVVIDDNGSNIQLDVDQRLSPREDNDHWKRANKYKHSGGYASGQFKIEQVEVYRGSEADIWFKAKPELDANGGSKGFHVMIWTDKETLVVQ